MIVSLETIDLAQWLGALNDEVGTASRTGALPGHTLEVVRVVAGERWDAAVHVAARVLVVMDGLGTIIVDDWRATLGPGIAAGVPAKKKVAIIADGERAVTVMLLGPPLPPEPNEPIEAEDASPEALDAAEPPEA